MRTCVGFVAFFKKVTHTCISSAQPFLRLSYFVHLALHLSIKAFMFRLQSPLILVCFQGNLPRPPINKKYVFE